MVSEYAPPAPGTPPEEWSEDQHFEYEWVGQTVFDDMSDSPENKNLDVEAFDKLWQKYRDWYFWHNYKIPGHEDQYDW